MSFLPPADNDAPTLVRDGAYYAVASATTSNDAARFQIMIDGVKSGFRPASLSEVRVLASKITYRPEVTLWLRRVA